MVRITRNSLFSIAIDIDGLVNIARRISVPSYGYGPFGEVIRESGAMAKVNPFRFATQYYDDKNDIVWYPRRPYSPSTGRWLSRDPIEEEGGENLYIFCGNDSLNNWDLLGEKWSITRVNVAGQAPAISECDDTWEDLAKLMKLDVSDYQKWANTSDSQPIPGKVYLTPNTIYLEFGETDGLDFIGPIPEWRQFLFELRDAAKGAGYKVVEHDPSSSAQAKQDLRSEDIYGFGFAGHGGGNGATPNVVGELVFKKGEGNQSDGLDGARYSRYGINFLYAYACSSAQRTPNTGRMLNALHYRYSPWERTVAIAGEFQGIWGEVNGYQVWSHLVSTPGTNSR
jgi:RHS repeat-associated protein